MSKTNQLNTKQEHTLAYDNQVIATEKYDARRTYKKCEGYQPGVASIGKNIVYIEGRNGNSPAKYRQEETLTRAFSLLDQQGICIKHFRADSASCQQKGISLVQGTSQHFYIRAVRCATMEQQISQIRTDAWKKVRLGVQEMDETQLADYRPFDGQKPYRLVVSRIKRRDGQTGLFTWDDFAYRAILTNDVKWDNQQMVSFYNQRGNVNEPSIQ